MNKPEDIPQDVWEAAERFFDLAITNPDRIDRPAPTYIARAILAERQRCAEIVAEVLEQIDINPHSPAVDDGGRVAANKIASYIRGANRWPSPRTPAALPTR